MKVASVTVIAISQGFRLGFQTVTGAGGGMDRGSAAAALMRFLSLVEARAVVGDAETERWADELTRKSGFRRLGFCEGD
jgi:hypothetical protein